MSERIADITPSPRILRMLGRIDFHQWQCLAELIDNAVDAFLVGRESGHGTMFPQVNVEISSNAEILQGIGTIRVTDNAPGMALDKLESAVRAGFSGNNSVDKLGLFGMGFNVATARLGACTEVWSTRVEDEVWSGVRIDFDELEESGSFATPFLQRPKAPFEQRRHGTEIIISKLDVERVRYLRTPGGLRATREKLSRIYNKIMREVGLRVLVADQPLATRDFCVWDEGRTVPNSRFGRVPARLPIHQDFGNRNYCEDCWVWLLEAEETCPACNSSRNLRMRNRQVTGWIGIQRFFDLEDYGIDLIRNGRIIEERTKHFFSWETPDGDRLPEYPIEQQHWGGRIVGELSIDFVPLEGHHKDAFDHNTQEWRMVLAAVRGRGPILPNIRKDRFGYDDENDSPLARLHSAYRRGSPCGLNTLVPGNSAGKGINTEPQRWATLFWEGKPDYQSDKIWHDAVLFGEEARNKNKGKKPRDDREGNDLFDEPDEPGEEETKESPSTDVEHERDPFLSFEADLPEMSGSPRLRVQTERLVRGSLSQGLHLELAPVGNNLTVIYDPNHEIFTKTLADPLGCVLEELGYQFLQRSGQTQVNWPISRIVHELRKRHFASSLDSVEEVRAESIGLLNDLIEWYVEGLMSLSPLPDDEVDDEERARVVQGVVRMDRAGLERAAEVIRTGLYPKYIGHQVLPALVQRRPELVLDGKFFSVSFTDVPEELRAQVVERVTTPIRDLLWIAETDDAGGSGNEWRNMLARAAASLRLLSAWRC